MHQTLTQKLFVYLFYLVVAHAAPTIRTQFYVLRVHGNFMTLSATPPTMVNESQIEWN